VSPGETAASCCDFPPGHVRGRPGIHAQRIVRPECETQQARQQVVARRVECLPLVSGRSDRRAGVTLTF
jgi:hypothetical protein